MFEEILGEHPKLKPVEAQECADTTEKETSEHPKLIPAGEETKIPNFAAIAADCFLPEWVKEQVKKEKTGE